MHHPDIKKRNCCWLLIKGKHPHVAINNLAILLKWDGKKVPSEFSL